MFYFIFPDTATPSVRAPQDTFPVISDTSLAWGCPRAAICVSAVLTLGVGRRAREINDVQITLRFALPTMQTGSRHPFHQMIGMVFRSRRRSLTAGRLILQVHRCGLVQVLPSAACRHGMIGAGISLRSFIRQEKAEMTIPRISQRDSNSIIAGVTIIALFVLSVCR